MKTQILSCTVALGLAVGLSPAQAQDAATTTHHKTASADLLFAKKAAAGGLTEVQLGQLASQNGDTQSVKDFGSKMVTDHGKANDALKAVAAKDTLTIPDKPTDDQQTLIDKLTKETGKTFDKAYIHAMVKAHVADKALFAEEAENGKNPDLKQFAQDTLPVIKEHLSMIEDIANGKAPASMQGMTGSSGESKSGLAPGSNANPVPNSPTTSGASSADTNPNSAGEVGSSGESKSGLAPGSNANPVPATTP
jgi:putative membrane protein